MMKSSSSAPSWKSLQGGVVSEDSSSEESDDDDVVAIDHSTTVTTRRKRPHRTPPPSAHATTSPVSTRRRTSSASSASFDDAASAKSSSAATSSPNNSIARGGVACPFPWKLHDMLDLCSGERDPLVTWNSDGTAFCVLNAKAFVQTILPRFFAQTKYASFQRQLNLYGFTRYSMPLDPSSNKSYSFYAHPHFLRGQRERVRCMIRCKIKGTGKKRHEDDEDDDGYHGDEKRSCQRESAHETEPTVEPLNDAFILLPEDGNVVETNEWKLESTVTMMLPPTDDEEAWVPSLTLDVNPDGTIEDGELAFFEGNPFHVLEPPTTHRLSSPKPLPLCMQPIAGGGGNDEYAPSVVWSTPKNESWYLGDRSQLPKVLNREQQRMILEPTSALMFHDCQVPWCTPNGGGILRTAQV